MENGFSYDTKILWKSGISVNYTTVQELYDIVKTTYNGKYTDIDFYNKGRWDNGSLYRMYANKLYEITLSNNDIYTLGANTKCVGLEDDVEIKSLKEGDYVYYHNKFSLGEIPGYKIRLNFDDGLILGFIISTGKIEKDAITIYLSDKCWTKYKEYFVWREYTETVNNNIYEIRMTDEEIMILAKAYIENNMIAMNCLIYPLDFRRGLAMALYYDTNRYITENKEEAERIRIFINSLGAQSSLKKDKSTYYVDLSTQYDETSYPDEDTYCWYCEDFYWKVKSIKKIDYYGYIYNVKYNTDKNHITLPFGLTLLTF